MKSLGISLKVSNALKTWVSSDRTTPTATWNISEFWISRGMSPVVFRQLTGIGRDGGHERG